MNLTKFNINCMQVCCVGREQVRLRHFCDNIIFFQCVEGVLLKTVLPICIYSFVKMVTFCAEMGVAYLEINKLPCLHEIDIPKCINVQFRVYSMYRTKLGVIGCFVLSFLLCFQMYETTFFYFTCMKGDREKIIEPISANLCFIIFAMFLDV